MKNAMSWFDINFKTKTDNKIDEALLRLFDLMKESLHIYFNIENSSDIHEFLKIAASKNDAGYPFLEWIKEKGIPRLRNINFNKLPNDDRFLVMIEFDEFVLQNEMDFVDPEEVRGCIISTVNSLQEYINICHNKT